MFFSQITIDKPPRKLYNIREIIHKGGAPMFASKFYFFFYFSMGCPFFVKLGK